MNSGEYAQSSLYTNLFGGKKGCGCGNPFSWKGGAKKGTAKGSGSASASASASASNIDH